jgi:GNAT superfamily N-acetyltransferase
VALVATFAERPDLAERANALDIGGQVWPEYNRHGDVMNRYWPRLDREFAEFQFVLHDPERDELLAMGCTIPCAWDGTVDGLPAGIDGAIEDAFALAASAGRPTALCALAVEILPAHQGGGLSVRMLEAMRSLAAAHGLPDLIAPLRPSLKARYPLAPIERYVEWTRPDGEPFDPWIRVHRRLGADVLRPEPRSLRITGTVAEWEDWTGMAFPDSGDYVFPEGLAPLAVDREADRGRYWEPNVWLRHRAPA